MQKTRPDFPDVKPRESTSKYCGSIRARKIRCVPSLDTSSPNTLEAIVDAYIEHYRGYAREEISFYARRHGDLTRDAIFNLFNRKGGKRHNHQRRIPIKVIARVAGKLANARITKPKNFEFLYTLIEDTIGTIRGIGPLTLYDLAHRIGARFGVRPNLVYLHSGTQVGARALNLKGQTLHPSSLPQQFKRLTAEEIEDCLCIYKDDLRLHGLSKQGTEQA